MAHDVFISYSAKDKPIADAVCAGLESRSVRCWIAPRDVLTTSLRTTDWAPAIIDAIRHTKLMVLVYSSNSNQSDQVRRELDSAMRYDVPILPFRIEDVPVSEKLEWYLSLPHWLDALTPPLEKHIEELASTARILVDRLTEQDEDRGGEPEPEPHDKEPEADRHRAAADELVEQARLAMDQTRYDDVLRLVRQALEIDASHVGARSLQEAAERLIAVERQLDEARAALRAGRFEQAIGPTEAALRADPHNVEAQELRAEAKSALSSGEATSAVASEAVEAREGHEAPTTEESSNGRTTTIEEDRERVIPEPITPTFIEQLTAYAREHRIRVAAAAVAVLLLVGIVAAKHSDWGVPTRPIQLDQPVMSTLSGGGGARERWELTLTSTEDLRIELTNLGADYDLYVTGPNGRNESSIRGGTTDDVVTIPRAPAGRYQIEVKAVYETSSQPYRLAALRASQTSPTPGPGGCAPGVNACALPLGQSVSAVITSTNSTHRWSLDLAQPGDLRIELTNLPADYDLFVTGPGNLRDSSTRAAQADDVVTFRAAPAGRYEVTVRPATGVTPSNLPYRLTATQSSSTSSGSTGPAVFATPTSIFSTFDWSSFFGSFSCTQPTASTRPLTLGQPGSGVLSASDRTHTWTFTLPSPADLRVELSNLDVDYDLSVHTPDGDCRSSTNAGAQDDVVELQAAPAGDYTIVVWAVADPGPRPYRITATTR